nr:Scr1 family TA system antitoxin-like transcriptional regulator [Saccharopolyspora elongata]
MRYIDDKKALAAHDTAWARLSAAALSFAQTRKFLAQVAREFKE